MSAVPYLDRGGVVLWLRHVRVVDVEHVVADHLFPHAAWSLSHFQNKLVQVRTNGGTPESTLTQQLVLQTRPLLTHVLQRVLLALQEILDSA